MAGQAASRGSEVVSEEERSLVQSSWGVLIDEANPSERKAKLTAIGVALFNSLFEQYPQTLAFFPFKGADGKPIPAKMEAHGLLVTTALGEIVAKMGDPEDLERYAKRLIERHMSYGIQLAHYDIVLGVVAGLVSGALTAHNLWDDAMAGAWTKLVVLIKHTAEKSYNNRVGDAAVAADMDNSAA